MSINSPTQRRNPQNSPLHSQRNSSEGRGSPPHNNVGKVNILPRSFFGMYLAGDVGDPTRLHVAIKEGDINTVRAILKKDKDLVHSRDKNGRTALHWTVVLGTSKCTMIILRSTSWWYLDRCDNNGCTALHYAAQSGKSHETKKLLNKGAYANARDLRNRTPMHYAVLVGNVFIIKKLLNKKGDLWLIDNDGNLPIDLTDDPEIIALVERLMEPTFSCFAMCFPKPSKEKGKLAYANRFPYHQEANKVKRVLPKDMLKDMMVADAKRNKHELEHRKV